VTLTDAASALLTLWDARGGDFDEQQAIGLFEDLRVALSPNGVLKIPSGVLTAGTVSPKTVSEWEAQVLALMSLSKTAAQWAPWVPSIEIIPPEESLDPELVAALYVDALQEVTHHAVTWTDLSASKQDTLTAIFRSVLAQLGLPVKDPGDG
jgi:hypothetical protein